MCFGDIKVWVEDVIFYCNDWGYKLIDFNFKLVKKSLFNCIFFFFGGVELLFFIGLIYIYYVRYFFFYYI